AGLLKLVDDDGFHRRLLFVVACGFFKLVVVVIFVDVVFLGRRRRLVAILKVGGFEIDLFVLRTLLHGALLLLALVRSLCPSFQRTKLREFIRRCESDTLGLRFGFAGALFAFHNVFRLPVFLVGVAVALGVLLVHGRVADRLGFFRRMTATLFALFNMFDLTVFFRTIAMAFRHAVVLLSALRTQPAEITGPALAS
ncbi:MAG TPA: hypothetical protein VH054_09080, partial [Polyangiaceae bacterium]|nr:hypothetical protein [Polyangiaceae bacterium]